MDLDLVLKPENFENLAQLMMHALKNKEDSRIAQAACEFWSALVCGTAENEEKKIAILRQALPLLLPVLMDCCLMTENDRMAIIESKEEDVIADRRPKGIQKEGEELEEDDENYEVDLSDNSLTLRKTAAFAIGRFTLIFNDDVWDALK